MRLDQSSIDISTLIDKILRGEVDLQPDFQRGQVWPEAKKRRLIDTILRNWYVPAIHIVVNDEIDREEILDGQQRLRSVIDFIEDRFTVDGSIEPHDEFISSLNGLRYSQLPISAQSRFKRFTINTIRLRDYRPEEPGELFFRLNQLTALTAAEQRNALIGVPRNQIKELATVFDHQTAGGIGFTNARLNYDDTLSRLAVTLEKGSLSAKISSASLERRYRSQNPFKDEILTSMRSALSLIADSVIFSGTRIRLNKASLFSWLYIAIELDAFSTDLARIQFAEFFEAFEAAREGVPTTTAFTNAQLISHSTLTTHPIGQACISIFNDRASSRVNDVTSVLLRDLCLHVCVHGVGGDSLRKAIGHSRGLEIAQLSDRLASMPSDVAERSVTESSLAKRWEAIRAES